MPVASVMARMKTPMNFWPSCAPCMNATPAPATICAQRNTWSDLTRSKFLQTRAIILVRIQPEPKPRNVESTRP